MSHKGGCFFRGERYSHVKKVKRIRKDSFSLVWLAHIIDEINFFCAMNILIVEDEVPVANFLHQVVRDISGVNMVYIEHTFEGALEKALSNSFDIILIDIALGLNDRSGLELCKKIRDQSAQVPIIIVTALKHHRYLEQAFSLGVNDYITKPFSPQELRLRIERWGAFRRHGSFEPHMGYNGLSYDAKRNEFYFQQQKLQLTKKNKILLKILLQSPERVVFAQEIKEKLWGIPDPGGQRRSVRSSVHFLRKALGPPCSDWIQTVRGEGYMLHKG